MNRPSLVVKLGGSHLEAPSLLAWLRVIAASAPLLLVPGGGAFADTVRAMQPRLGFSDRAAHDMSLLAMNQFGRLLCDLQPGLKMTGDFAAVETTIAARQVAVLAPWPMLVEEPTLAASWDVTSDSLALWFARHYRSNLLIVKRARPSGDLALATLSASAFLDRAFPRLSEDYSGAFFIAGEEDIPAHALDSIHLPGVAVPLRGLA